MDPIHLTPAARIYLCDLLLAADEIAILLSVNSKGCGGHSYVMRFVDADFGGEAINLDECHRLILDRTSLLWLWGVQIDFQDTGLDQQLSFKSPLETGRCGCGQSFTCG
jgi:iron-sulfur cluster assembly protein